MNVECNNLEEMYKDMVKPKIAKYNSKYCASDTSVRPPDKCSFISDDWFVKCNFFGQDLELTASTDLVRCPQCLQHFREVEEC